MNGVLIQNRSKGIWSFQADNVNAMQILEFIQAAKKALLNKKYIASFPNEILIADGEINSGLTFTKTNNGKVYVIGFDDANTLSNVEAFAELRNGTLAKFEHTSNGLLCLGTIPHAEPPLRFKEGGSDIEIGVLLE